VSVLDPGRASALTSAAEKTKVKMFLEAVVELDATVRRGLHEVNPAARRLWFQAESPIGRALIETKAAVDAPVELREI